MSKTLNIGFKIVAPLPIDSRMKVSTFAGLANIAVPYSGLITYVEDENKDYRYVSGVWSVYAPGGSGGATAWGDITGNISDQTDIFNSLALKFNKIGGTITGSVVVQSTVEADNFISIGSQSTIPNVVISTITGEPVGSSVVSNIVFISTADYNQAVIDLTLVVGTAYIQT